MECIDHIFYINLDHRTDRRKEIEQELEGLGVPFERFPAILHSNGAIGCSASHLAVAKLAKERGYTRWMVVEDDFQLLVSKEEFKEAMARFFSRFPAFDVLMLVVTNPTLETLDSHHAKIIQSFNTGGMCIDKGFIDTHISLLERGKEMLEETGDLMYTCDTYWQRVMPYSNFYTFLPPIAIQRPSYSDINQCYENYFNVKEDSTPTLQHL